MSRKKLFRQSNNQTVAEIFERFVASQTAKGVSDKTIRFKVAPVLRSVRRKTFAVMRKNMKKFSKV